MNQSLRSDDFFVVVVDIPWYDMRFPPLIQLEWVGGWMNSWSFRFYSKYNPFFPLFQSTLPLSTGKSTRQTTTKQNDGKTKDASQLTTVQQFLHKDSFCDSGPIQNHQKYPSDKGLKRFSKAVNLETLHQMVLWMPLSTVADCTSTRYCTRTSDVKIPVDLELIK